MAISRIPPSECRKASGKGTSSPARNATHPFGKENEDKVLLPYLGLMQDAHRDTYTNQDTVSDDPGPSSRSLWNFRRSYWLLAMDNGRNYNHPSSFFENNHQIYHETEMHLNASSNGVTNHSPWKSSIDLDIGLSDVTSPDNSDSQTSENPNANPVVTSLLQVMNNSPQSFDEDNISRSSITINNICRDINTPCENCKIAHQSEQRSPLHSRYTPSTYILEQPIRNTYNQITNSSSMMDIVASNVACNVTSNVASNIVSNMTSNVVSNIVSSPPSCNVHLNGQRLYCQTCSQTVCGDCGNSHHRGHVTVHLMEAVEYAGLQAKQAMAETRHEINILRNDLEALQSAAEALDQRARQATADVMLCIRRVASALESRERELLGKIEKARMLKFAALKTRDKVLRNCISRLTNVVDKLGEAMETVSLTSGPLDLLMNKDRASAEIFQMRQNRHNSPTPEENWISFTGSDNNALHSIANLGSVVLNNPGPIGDRRALGRTRGYSPFFSQSSIIPYVPNTRGCPVPGSTVPIIVRSTHLPMRTLKIIGNDGDALDNLCRPWGVACDSEGHIIVADRSNNRIQIYRQDGSLVAKFGCHGNGPGQFDRPAGVAVDCRQRLIVADKDNHRIQILTMEGLFLLTFGEKGCLNGQFNYPWDVATNSECQIVVSDTRNHRVQLFSAEGVFLRKYGHESVPSMWKHFDSPRGVAFDPNGNVVITDFNNHRIVVVDSGFENGRVMICETGNAPKQFLRPQGIMVDDDGNIIVADSRNHQIQVFDSAGAFKWKFGTYGNGPDEMDRPSGIALCPDGKIAIVDFGNNRVILI